MKIIIKENALKDNPENIMRRAGYGYIYSRDTEKGSFVRRITRNHYPRFHMYIKRKEDEAVFDLHLDQRQASYPGAHAHNAEYGGAVVEKEAKRLQEFIGLNENINKADSISKNPSAENKIGCGKIENQDIAGKKQSWLKKFLKIIN